MHTACMPTKQHAAGTHFETREHQYKLMYLSASSLQAPAMTQHAANTLFHVGLQEYEGRMLVIEQHDHVPSGCAAVR